MFCACLLVQYNARMVSPFLEDDIRKIAILVALAFTGWIMACSVDPNPLQKASSPEKEISILSEKSERIQFSIGKTGGSWTRDVPATGAIDYVIGAKKGQVIEYSIRNDFSDHDIDATLTEPESLYISQKAGPKEWYEFAVEKNGDHHLRLTNRTDKQLTITLYLGIR